MSSLFYTSQSGIWKSVWLESVPNEYIKSLKIDTGSSDVSIYFEGIETTQVTFCNYSSFVKFYHSLLVLNAGFCDKDDN